MFRRRRVPDLLERLTAPATFTVSKKVAAQYSNPTQSGHPGPSERPFTPPQSPGPDPHNDKQALPTLIYTHKHGYGWGIVPSRADLKIGGR